MISPEIWESQDFSQLSDIAKIVFISLISHADDEGRGRADPTFIKSSTFPYDEGRRVADIKSALSEIARSMSVQFYSVNGIEFYFITSWKKWQKVDKPSKSKLPPPPIVGEGGVIHSSEKFDECSDSTQRMLDECSAINRIEENRILHTNTPVRAHESFEQTDFEIRFKAFCEKWNVSIDNYSTSITELDFEKLDKAYSESKKFLQVSSVARTISWIIKNSASILAGKYKDNDSSDSKKEIKGHWEDKLNNLGRID